MSIFNQIWECMECGWHGHEDELNSQCTFYATQEEPAEYDVRCPDCGDDWDNFIEYEEPEDESFGISIADAIVNNHQETEAAMRAIFGPDYRSK